MWLPSLSLSHPSRIGPGGCQKKKSISMCIWARVKQVACDHHIQAVRRRPSLTRPWVPMASDTRASRSRVLQAAVMRAAFSLSAGERSGVNEREEDVIPMSMSTPMPMPMTTTARDHENQRQVKQSINGTTGRLASGRVTGHDDTCIHNRYMNVECPVYTPRENDNVRVRVCSYSKYTFYD